MNRSDRTAREYGFESFDTAVTYYRPRLLWRVIQGIGHIPFVAMAIVNLTHGCETGWWLWFFACLVYMMMSGLLLHQHEPLWISAENMERYFDAFS